MDSRKNQKSIIYIGDFDLRNQNVQAHLVLNNAKILNHMGYRVFFVGVNREATTEEIKRLDKLKMDEGNEYMELDNTLSFSGIFKYHKLSNHILTFMNEVAKNTTIDSVISYQAPTFAPILKKIALWCRSKRIKYIVNCADITIFDSQPLLRRFVMTWNWRYLHCINKKYADGLIAVSRYIEEFYYKEGMPSVIIPPLFDDFVESDFKLADRTTFVYAGTPFVLKKDVNTHGMKDRLDKIVDLCLRLSANNVEYRFVVIGITKDLYTFCIPRHKKALELNNDIVFCGRLPHKDTLNAVKNADYMLNVRDINVMNKAGLPTKLVESVSLGTPVIMNNVGDNFLYLTKGTNGFELSGDTETDVALLQTLCKKNMEERREQKNKCARDRTFAIEKFEPKFARFIRDVLNNYNKD